MYCRRCNYRLWMLRTRECPECGTPFRPSEYEFVPSSVQFRCPHCEQPYYGTDAQGHLVPIEFDCARCGRHIHMDEMVLFPTEGLREEDTATEHMPWLERSEKGVVTSWLKTVGMALVQPGKLMRLTPPSSSLWQAWWFAILTWVVYTCCCMGLIMLIVSLSAGGGRGVVFMGGATGGVLATILAVPLLGIAVWGASIHILLALTGGSAGGLHRTYQALCYSLGATVLVAIPCIGIYATPVALIWWAVSAILMIRESQKVHGARAVLAVSVMPALIAALMVVLIFAAVQKATQASAKWAAATQASAASTRSSGVRGPLTAIIAYGMTHNGTGPDHVLRMIIDDDLAPEELLASQSATRLTDIPAGGTTLDQLRLLHPQAARAELRKELAGAPAAAMDYRLGDCVFCYRGIDLRQAEPKLWLVIMAPDPDVNAALPKTIEVGLADGSTSVVPASSLGEMLAKQNSLRAAQGLPALADPRQVRHARASAPATTPWRPGSGPRRPAGSAESRDSD